MFILVLIGYLESAYSQFLPEITSNSIVASYRVLQTFENGRNILGFSGQKWRKVKEFSYFSGELNLTTLPSLNFHLLPLSCLGPVSIKASYRCTTTCKTSHCCLFSLWKGSHIWVLPEGPAAFYNIGCHLRLNLLNTLAVRNVLASLATS